MMTKKLRMMVLVLPAVLLMGCAGFHWGPGHVPENFDYVGPGNAYASYNDLRDYDGDIVKVDMMNDTQINGEIVNVDVWPLVGVGVGVLGIRAHIFSLGAGVGTLFYYPRSSGYLEDEMLDDDDLLDHDDW